MAELKEIKERISKVIKEYEDYSVYILQIKKIQDELNELNIKEESPGKKSKVLRLQKEICELEAQETENAIEAYPELVASFNTISSPIVCYFARQLDNDKEVQRLKHEYKDAQDKLVKIAVEHNLRLKEKLDQAKQEITNTGFYELGSKIADNRIVGLLGYRLPETNYIRFYKSEDREILVPEELKHIYEEVLREYETKWKLKEEKPSFLKGLLF